MTDWLNEGLVGGLGAMLLFKACSLAPVQYVFGCSQSARKVFLAAGFKEIRKVPCFHKVHTPWKDAVWRELHGPIRVRSVALFGIDLVQAARGWVRSRTPAGGLVARRVERFGDEPARVVRKFDRVITMTTRDARLLNHLLQHPTGCLSGWLLEQGGRLRGFAVLSMLDEGVLRMGRVAELFLDSTDPALWRWALAALEDRLSCHRPHLISAYGSTPWMHQALRARGFFRRGSTSFYLRDTENRIDCRVPVHLTHLEADLAYI
jgi:hypothetical protein